MIRMGSTGTSATRVTRPSVIQVLPPQGALRQSEQRPATSRTDLLIVAAIRKLILESQFLLDDREIPNHRLRGEWLAAAAAGGLLRPDADIFVEPDPELSRTLEDMKELAERQPQQRDDDRR